MLIANYDVVPYLVISLFMCILSFVAVYMYGASNAK